MKLSRWLFLAALVGLGLAAYAFRDPITARLQTARGAPPAPAAAAPQAAPVEVARVTTGRVADEVEAVGTLSANETVTIAPEIAGRITALPFEEGQRVKRGATLVELDSSILDGELKQAQSELALAEEAFARATELARRGAGTTVAVQQTTAQRVAASVKVELARTRLEKMRLVAPFDGVVGLRNISAGNYVTVGQAIVTVSSLDPIKVDFRLPELYLAEVRRGQKVDVRVDAFPDRRFAGEVYAIDPLVDVNGRAVRLRARVANKDGALAPGLFARVSVTIGQRENALLIPESALAPQPTGATVYVVEDGKARVRAVKVGKRLPGQVEIAEGLAAGEVVVTAGQMRLRDGVAVSPQSRQAQTQPAATEAAR
ncbi:MAG TPA: efflux RND transporter periplasmic adaptor subunit [Beijerinckiaceae bacterium]|jgi:membrane fusion protein (multidrug efflux system)